MAERLRATPTPTRARPRPPRTVLTRLLGVGTAAALGIDAYVHAGDAGFYDAVRTSLLSQGTLFRLEAGLAALIAVALLLRPSWPWFAAAFLVAASALGAVLLYTYIDVGTLGPLPNMYEPTWALPGKPASAWAEGAGVVLAATGLLTPGQPGHRDRHRPTAPGSERPARRRGRPIPGRARRPPPAAAPNSPSKGHVMNQQHSPRPRPTTAPPYYLGHPADWWITRLRGRRGQRPPSTPTI